MNKQYIIDKTPVWLEYESVSTWSMQLARTPDEKKRVRIMLATSLANHLCNNWDQTHPIQIEWTCLICYHEQSYVLLANHIPYCESCGIRSLPPQARHVSTYGGEVLEEWR